MGINLDSPLSGRVKAGRGGGSTTKRKVLLGVAGVSVIPFLLSTFAASVTIGTGPLEFGQGSQQAIACDENVFIALGEEWHAIHLPKMARMASLEYELQPFQT